MRSIAIGLFIALIGLQYKLWIGDGSVLQWQQLEQQIAEQRAENQQLLARNSAIEADIIELKSGAQALEEKARYEFGMIKSNETYFQLVD